MKLRVVLRFFFACGIGLVAGVFASLFANFIDMGGITVDPVLPISFTVIFGGFYLYLELIYEGE